MTMTYQQLIKEDQQLAREKPSFTEYGLLLCGNRCGTPASASLSIAVGWIGCGPCITGESKSFDDEDLVLGELKAA
jgi:hypothetical protein